MVENICMRQTPGSRWARPKIDHKEFSMGSIYYIGLDMHKKMIAYCIKSLDGRLNEGAIIIPIS